MVRQDGAGQVWVKPLAGGARAVALLNRGATAQRIAISARAIGLPRARRYRIEKLWARTAVTTRSVIGARVGSHAAVLYRVTAEGRA
jgi:alpha-galactosidase